MKLFYLILKFRFVQQTSLLKRLLSNYNKKISTGTYVLLSFVTELFFSLILSIGGFLFLQKFSLNARFYLFSLMILGVFNGLESYRRTHVFPFETLREFSPKSEKNASRVLLLANFVYQLLFSSTFFLTLSALALMSLISVWERLVAIPVILFVYASFYYLSNRFLGTYMYSKQIRKVGLLRIFVYLLSGMFWFFVGRSIIVFIYYRIYFYICKYFKNTHDLFDKKTGNRWAKEMMNYYITEGKRFFTSFLALINQTTYEQLLIGALFIVLCVIVGLRLPIHLLPVNKKVNVSSKWDFCNFYVRHFKKFTKKRNDSILIKNNLLVLTRKRWLFANGFFEYVFITYESYAYLEICSTIIFLIKNSPISQIQVLMLMNLYMMGNQTCQVTRALYPYFSLSIERDQFPFIQMSPIGFQEVFFNKLWILRKLFSSSLIVLLGIDLFFFFMTDITILNFLGSLLIVGIGSYVYPLIQMYMVPLATKTDFANETEIGESKDEEFVLDKFQEIPRKILVQPITLIAFSFFFISDSWKKIVFPIELIYLFLATGVIIYFCRKFFSKGLLKLNEIKQ